MVRERKQVILRMSPEEAQIAEDEAKNLGISKNSFFLLLLKQFHNGIQFQKEKKEDRDD